LYNQEVLDGHREAVAALRELLATETDPHERRKLANALLKARPMKTATDDEREGREKPRTARNSDADAQPKYGPEHVPAAIAHLSGLLAMLNRDEDDEERDDMIDKPMAESS
jgi:hypothetical protein